MRTYVCALRIPSWAWIYRRERERENTQEMDIDNTHWTTPTKMFITLLDTHVLASSSALLEP